MTSLDKLRESIADLQALANEANVSPELYAAILVVKCHAIQVGREANPVPPQSGLIGDTPATGLRVREK